MPWLALIAALAADPGDAQQLASIDETGVVRRTIDGGRQWTVVGRCDPLPEPSPILGEAETESTDPFGTCPAHAGSLAFAGNALVIACPDGELLVDGEVTAIALALDEHVTAIAHDGDALLVATSAGILYRGSDVVPLPEPTRALASSDGEVIVAGETHLWRWSAGGWLPIAPFEACAVAAGAAGAIASGPAGVVAFGEWRATIIDPRPHVAVAASGRQVWISDGTAPRPAAEPRDPWRPTVARAPLIDRDRLASRARRARWLPRLDLVVSTGHAGVDVLGPTFHRARTTAFSVFATLTWNLDGVLDADILPLAGLTP